MLKTEELNWLWLQTSKDPYLVHAWREELELLIESPRYREWHRSEPRQAYQLTGDERFPALLQSGLVRDGVLQIKANRIGSRVFITDGAWVTDLMRVFPDPDEALVLLDHVKSQNLETWADWVVDPAAGCGHTPIGFLGPARRLACDANVRALTYSRLNARLNAMGPDQFWGLLNDMTEGLPPHLELKGNVLLLANVPFAPAPREGLLALNSAGGTTGADLQLASFRLAEQFHRRSGQPLRACSLTWTMGSLQNDEWEVPTLMRQVFPEARITWKLVDHDYDHPELANPGTTPEIFESLARSQYAITKSHDQILKEYQNLGRQLEGQGLTHVAYGILDCELGT